MKNRANLANNVNPGEFFRLDDMEGMSFRKLSQVGLYPADAAETEWGTLVEINGDVLVRELGSIECPRCCGEGAVGDEPVCDLCEGWGTLVEGWNA